MTRLAALLATLALALTACSGASADAGCERLPGVRPGLCITPAEDRIPAPDVAVPVLGDDGSELSVTDLRGDVVVLNFWASWCGPCRAEQPDLNIAHAQLEDRDVTFLGVNIQDSTVNALAHEREFAIPYDSLFDPANAYAARYEGVGPRSIPTTIVIDQEGRVAARLFGTLTGPQEVVTIVDRLLSG